MQLLAHRGYWMATEEKNTLTAMQRAFEGGYGVETDIRDFNEQIVISHDIATSNAYNFESLLQLYVQKKASSCLALNIKADGLIEQAEALLNKWAVKNYFFFDMSIPETIKYRSKSAIYFIRYSEFENANEKLEQTASGIWLDAFTNIWYEKDFVNLKIAEGKQIAIVSPELHGRDYMQLWEMIKDNEWHLNDKLLLCTDIPLQAKQFFNL